MNNELVAIFAVVMIVFGGFWFLGAAMPEDIEYMATVEERTAELNDKLADGKQMLYNAYVAGQISRYQLMFMVEHIETVWAKEIVEYEKMYNYLNETVWTTDDEYYCSGSVEVDNVEFTINEYGYTVNMGPGTFSWTCEGQITVDLSNYPIVQVRATATAFDGEAQTATLNDIVLVFRGGFERNYPGTFNVSW